MKDTEIQGKQVQLQRIVTVSPVSQAINRMSISTLPFIFSFQRYRLFQTMELGNRTLV